MQNSPNQPTQIRGILLGPKNGAVLQLLAPNLRLPIANAQEKFQKRRIPLHSRHNTIVTLNSRINPISRCLEALIANVNNSVVRADHVWKEREREKIELFSE
jgi:hypothetical protein